MKKIPLLFIILFIICLFIDANVFSNPPPKNKNYEKEWKIIDSLTDERLPLSAIELVNKIYNESKAENNYPQFVKSVIYKLKLESQREEGYDVKSIQNVKKEIQSSAFPVKNILHSMLAELYWSYYQRNRYKLLNRTETVNFKEDDIATWDIKKIVKECIYNYVLSLKDKGLEGIQINVYDAILTGRSKKTSAKLRPTLFDLLGHRAVDFFMNDEAGFTVPAYKFEIDNPDYFSDAEKFANLHITSKDSISMKLYAIKLLQKLVAFHMNDIDPQAMIDLELKRYKFLKGNAITDSKDSLYLNGLLVLKNKNVSSPFSTDIVYLIAQEYADRGHLYNPLVSDEHKWDIKTAIDYCNDAIKRFPDSNGANNCKNLIQSLKEPSLEITSDNEILPDKPALALVKFKNIKTVYFRIITIDLEIERDLKENVHGEDLIMEYLKYPSVKQWSLELPDDGDYQVHKTEIKLPELSKGYYVLLTSTSKDFSYNNQSVVYKDLQVTGLSYISRSNSNGSKDFYVLDRETGAPVSNVFVQTFYREYEKVSRTNKTIKWETFKTDNEGYFNVSAVEGNKSNNYLTAVFSNKGDKYATENYFYVYNFHERANQPVTSTYFFTDRAIYRPGQTIYFKGIMLESFGEKTTIKPNEKTTVTFYDANHKEVSKLDLVSNDYGSISGTFLAPTGVMNGQMSISNQSGNIQIRVEDYKRPKFEVTFDTIKGSYKLGGKVTIKGKAKAYAGNNIDDATVKYRVVRKARFPFMWGFRWDYYYGGRQQEMEITNGTLTTDANGEFTIDFKAITDKHISKHYQPVFDYVVSADVTDINGETHSSETNVTVGYNSLLADIDIPDKIDKTKDNVIKYKITNLNGAVQKVNGTLTIIKLKQPERILRSRRWDKPDKFVINRDDFYKMFPYDIYNDEDDITKWAKEKTMKIYDLKTDTLPANYSKLSTNYSQLPTPNSLLTEGNYMLEIKATDMSGEKLEKQTYFSVYSSKDKQLEEYSEDWFSMTKDKGEPGEKAGFIIGSKDKNVSVLYEVESKNKIISKQWIRLSDEKQLLEIPIKEDYRGNFAMHLTFVKNNRSYKHDEIITVPYTNKKVDIVFESFRNKLLPGQNDEWKITLKDKQGEKVAAELVAGMYDASLDAFVKNIWNFNIYNSYYSNRTWKNNLAFETSAGHVYKLSPPFKNNIIFNEYDKLNWFDFNLYGYHGHGYPRMMNAAEVQSNAVEPKSLKEVEVFSTADKKYLDWGEHYDESYVMINEKLDTIKLKPIEQPITMRTNFNETAFFYPMLETNENSEIVIKFTVPEALTRWKLLGFAHTKDLKYGQIEKELVTQKQLMITTNPPRFFREGDKIYFSAKVSNLSDNPLTGQAELFLYDATAANKVPLQILKGADAEKTFSVNKRQSAAVSWGFTVPDGVEAITYRIKAIADNYSDGEENTIPVLTNRMLVTEAMPLPIRGNQTKEFIFDKLVNSGKSGTMRNFKLTLEFTSNPAWLAIQALPYLMETKYESSDLLFQRFYANSIASFVVNSNPRIRNVFEAWKNFTTETLLSNLEKNQDLKSVILQETPWVLQAQNETERKQRVALLFDLNKMTNELSASLIKLEKLQKENGGWCWFEGMPESEYFTQYIISGLGHLKKLQITNYGLQNTDYKNMIRKALFYLDDKIREEYEWLKIHYPNNMVQMRISSQEIQYLYARSYFIKETNVNSSNMEAFEYFKGQANKYWNSQNIRLQGMIALSLFRFGDVNIANGIIKSFKERALHSEEMGMYWKDVTEGYSWYEAPIETQALLIETFDEIANDKDAIEEMKVWLLKQKQTQDWKTGSATADACYALLLKGTDILASDKLVNVTVGKDRIDPFKLDDTKVEAGTGYFKTSWSDGDIKPEMGMVKVTKTDDGVAWGALYWQYFEQLDKITLSGNQQSAYKAIGVEKKLFIERNTPSGPVIEPVSETTPIKVGDKIKVRIEIRVDRNMDYVHLKDMRAAGFEPVNVLSSYKYQGGIGYYETTLDASTNFFIPYLTKGTYVFEYALIATIKGDFSNGITSIQCLYAPEFGCHSEGIRVNITNN